MAKRSTGSDGGDGAPPLDGSNMPKVVELRMEAIWLALITQFDNDHKIALTPDVSFGWALFNASKRTAKPIEVWRSSASKDGHRTHVFLNACVTRDIEVVHLMCLAAVIVSLTEKHTRREFEDRAKKIGFDFPLTEAMKDGKKAVIVSKHPIADETLTAKLSVIAEANPFPGVGIDPASWTQLATKKKQETRMLAGRCTVPDPGGPKGVCGFTIRVAAIWAKKGPRCPIHDATLTIEWKDDDAPGNAATPPPKPDSGNGGAGAAPEPRVSTQDNSVTSDAAD